MDALADGDLGADDRPLQCAAVRTHSGRQTTPGDGIPFLSGTHPARGTIHAGTPRSRRPAGSPHGRLPVSEREVDPGKLARSATAPRACLAAAVAAAT